MQDMHIAVNGWFLGRSTTGSGQYLHHLLRYLPRRHPHARLTVYAPTSSHLPTASHAEADAIRFPDVNIVRLPLLSGPSSFAKLWWEQVTIPQAARAAQVLWTPYWAAPLWQPCPTVVTVHDLIPQLLPAYRGGLLQRLYTRLVGYTARRAAAIITVSHAGARDIAAHLGIPAARIHVVHHGPNHLDADAQSLSQERLEAVRARYGLPARFFLYLGGFDVRKNVAATVAAYARYLARGGDPTVKLVIAGALPNQDSDFAPNPRRLAAAQDWGDYARDEQVIYCGYVDDADKLALYALAHAYLFPSLYEGFGMMLLEAMSAGAPVITSGPTAESADLDAYKREYR
jgi:glycosyltransferase involved in cell wall biosynthesis